MKPNFFALNRKLLHSERWLAEPFTKGQAWVDMVGLAAHADKTIILRGKEIHLKRGQLAYSTVTLAKRWRWSKNKIRRTLADMVAKQDVDTVATPFITVITLKKYDEWQGDGYGDGYGGGYDDGTTIQEIKRNKRNINKKHNAEMPPQEELKPFSFEEKLQLMEREPKDKRMPIIAAFWKSKNLAFESKELYESAIRRSLRGAQLLTGYPLERVTFVCEWLSTHVRYKWTLETVSKFIDENLDGLSLDGKPTSDDEIFKQIISNPYDAME